MRSFFFFLKSSKIDISSTWHQNHRHHTKTDKLNSIKLKNFYTTKGSFCNSTRKKQIKKWAKELDKQFSEKDIQMANKYIKRCPTSPTIREMQIKTTLKYYFYPSGWPLSEEQKTANIGKDTENLDCSCILGGNIKW